MQEKRLGTDVNLMLSTNWENLRLDLCVSSSIEFLYSR